MPAGQVETSQSRRSPPGKVKAIALQQALAKGTSENDCATAATDVSSESSEESSVVSSSSSSSEEGSTDGRDRRRAMQDGRPQDIRSRLDSFLPLLREANRNMDRSADVGFEVDESSDEETHAEAGRPSPEDRQYIEMSLGLGVLEQRQPSRDSVVTSRHSELERSPNGHDDGVLQRDLVDTSAVTTPQSYDANHLTDQTERTELEAADDTS